MTERGIRGGPGIDELLTQARLTRRRFLGMAGVAVGGVALAACGGGGNGGGGGGGGGGNVDLTFMSYGGAYQDAQTKAWLDPFMKANPSINIVQEEPTDYAKIKAVVESGNTTLDVVDVGNDFGLARDQSILEPIDCTVVPCDQLQPKIFPTTGYRVPDIAYAVCVAYRTDAYGGKKPTSFADYFDLKGFPGKRGGYNFSSGGLLEMALIADGVSPDQLYPLDVNRAFKKLDTIKSQIVWWDTGAQSAQILADNEVTQGMSWNGRIYDIQQQGSPVEVNWDQFFLTADYLVIPKGTKHLKEAQQLVAYITSAEHSADLSKYISYAPPNVQAVDKADPAMAPYLPTSHMDGAVGFDDAWWNDNFDAVDTQWQTWVQS